MQSCWKVPKAWQAGPSTSLFRPCSSLWLQAHNLSPSASCLHHTPARYGRTGGVQHRESHMVLLQDFWGALSRRCTGHLRSLDECISRESVASCRCMAIMALNRQETAVYRDIISLIFPISRIVNSPLGTCLPILEREIPDQKTGKVCRKYQDSIGTLGMSRPLTCKNTNLDAELNPPED